MRVLLLTLSLVAAFAADRRAVVPAVGPKPVGPYTPGILAGDFLYVSGQGARRPDGAMPADPEEQTRQTLANAKAIIEAAGLTMRHVVYGQVYLSDMKSYPAMDRVWSQTFPSDPPARAVLGVARMPTETPVEITLVAVRDLAARRTLAPGIVAAADRVYIGAIEGASTEPVMETLAKSLRAAGLDTAHMVFTNVYLDGEITIARMNETYRKYFEFDNTPARATIQVNALPPGAHISVTGVAVRDLARRRAVRPRNMAPSPTASPCVWAGDALFCSAKSAFIPGPNSGIYADTVEHQVRQTMRNLLDGLEEAGLDFSHVVATNVYLDQLDEFQRMNATYAQYFGAIPPTRTTVQPLPPVERKRGDSGRFPMLEQISLIAVK